MKIVEYNYDVQTGQDTVIERDATAQEQAEREAFKAAAQASAAEATAKAAQRQAILNRLGITEEEARILLGGN
jgi:hypothetical protein